MGTLALAASGIPGTYLLPPLVADFHARHPGVEIDFQVATSGGAMELVRTHRVELAVLGGLTVPPELDSEPLLEDEVVLVGPLRLAGRRLRAKELEGETWISREEGSATRAAVEAARWQIGLRSVRTPNSTLPAPQAELLGRERELAQVLDLLRREDVRLVTLTGAGGSGKTRLALEVAAGLVDEVADGVYFVALAPLREPELVPAAIASVLGVPDGRDLEDRLSGCELLLVLDNLEQVVEAAAWIARLLEAAPHVRVLATSRVPLRVAAEHELRVEPLELGAAVHLFEQRARAVRPGFVGDESLATVCERLDRLPLALELAAARVRTLPTALLVDGLERRLPVLVGGRRDADERQRTLRATIAWSYDLLETPERVAFARLSVFAGGCDGEAAEAVCEVDRPTLHALADDNLLVVAPDGRFRMLELVRELAEEELAASGDEGAFRRRHAERVLTLAEETRTFARGPEEKAWLDRLALELDNVRGALRWSVAAAPGLGLTLAEALEPLWVRGQRQREGFIGQLEPAAVAAGRELSMAEAVELALSL
jgi:predicted ATPase